MEKLGVKEGSRVTVLGKEFREDDVRNFGPRAELVDVKVVAFSDTLSGLKMVVPLAKR